MIHTNPHPTKITWEEKNRGVYLNEKIDMSDWVIGKKKEEQQPKGVRAEQVKVQKK